MCAYVRAASVRGSATVLVGMPACSVLTPTPKIVGHFFCRPTLRSRSTYLGTLRSPSYDPCPYCGSRMCIIEPFFTEQQPKHRPRAFPAKIARALHRHRHDSTNLVADLTCAVHGQILIASAPAAPNTPLPAVSSLGGFRRRPPSVWECLSCRCLK